MPGAAEALLRAYNDRDLTRAIDLYREDGEHREIAQGQVHRGRDALRGSLEHFLAAFPDAHWAPVASVANGALSAVPYRLTGTLSARLGPFEPAGQRLDIEGVLVGSTDAAGQIEWTADYWDSGTFFKQMRAQRQQGTR